jgi:metallo-beta-lactamase class B
MHVLFKDLPGYGSFPSNGLVILGSAGVVLVDTPWGGASTCRLLDRVVDEIGPEQGVIVTHWHDDRLGGLAKVHRRGIPSFGLEATVSEAERHGLVAPLHVLDAEQPIGFGVVADVFFPGAGHTRDNLVVWLPEPGILFCGCQIHANDSNTLGNTADAELANWSEGVGQVEREFPSARIVVPGHGELGGPELLAHTGKLADEASGAR